jgi:hypothetical protein
VVKVVVRRQSPGGVDPEMLGLGVGMSVVLATAAWMAVRLPSPRCFWHALTGHACPTCGATRAVGALLHGDLTAALAWNPLVCIALLGYGLFALYAGVVLAARLPRVRLHTTTPRERTVLRAGAVAAIGANWAYLLAVGR